MFNNLATLESKKVKRNQRTSLPAQAFVLGMQKNEIAILQRAIAGEAAIVDAYCLKPASPSEMFGSC